MACLKACVNPVLGHHHKKCPNFGKSCYSSGLPLATRLPGGMESHVGEARGRSPLAQSKPHVALLLGKPASGKSTLGVKLAERFGYVCLDIGAHIRKAEPLPPGTDLDEFAMNVVATTLLRQKNVLLVGFPKRLRGFDFVLNMAEIAFALELQVDDDEVLKGRAAARHVSGLHPEEDEFFFQHRLDTFSGIKGPVLEKLEEMKLVRSIDASCSKENVEEAAYKVCAEAVEAGMGQSGGSRQRRDADEANFEVSICLLSGEERLRPLVPMRAKVGALRQYLIADGETEHDLNFSFNGQMLDDSALIRGLSGFHLGGVISMSRVNKPSLPKREGPCSRCGGPHARHDCVCFTADSFAHILSDGGEVSCAFRDLHVGDMVNTGQGGNNPYCCIQRVWAHHLEDEIPTYEISQGCRLTLGHPIYRNGKWIKPEDVCHGEFTFERTVYHLEVEGHVDTALVDGHVCALLGRYCGPDFGWNIFTRKTVLCDQQPCTKCSKAVVTGLSFNPYKLPEEMMPPARFEPY